LKKLSGMAFSSWCVVVVDLGMSLLLRSSHDIKLKAGMPPGTSCPLGRDPNISSGFCKARRCSHEWEFHDIHPILIALDFKDNRDDATTTDDRGTLNASRLAGRPTGSAV